MKYSLLDLLTCGAFFLINAQDIHIYYDVFKDSISYESDGVVVQDALVRKGNEIILHVTNYNDYLYDLEVTTAEENYAKPSAGIESLFLGGAGMTGLSQLQNLLGTPSGLGDVFNTGGSEGGDIFGYGSEGSREVLTTEMKTLQTNFSNLLVEISDIEEELADIRR